MESRDIPEDVERRCFAKVEEIVRRCAHEHGPGHQVETMYTLEPRTPEQIEGVERCIITLTHALRCDGCDRSICRRWKMLMEHTERCLDTKNCEICVHMQHMFILHAENCHRNPCAFPFCEATKERVAVVRRQQMVRDELDEMEPTTSKQAAMLESLENSMLHMEMRCCVVRRRQQGGQHRRRRH